MADQIRGWFPNGKINNVDEGNVSVKISEEKGNVKLEFDDPVMWLAMPPDIAVDLALAIIKRAKEIGLTKPVTLIL